MPNGVTYLRREPMTWLVRAFDAGTVGEEIDRIAAALRPKGGPSTLCCIYRDRTVIKYRLMALIGVSVEDETDELKRLSEYYAEKVAGNGIDKKSCTLLKLYAAGKLPANFLEVMFCPGGCVNGPGSLTRSSGS